MPSVPAASEIFILQNKHTEKLFVWKDVKWAEASQAFLHLFVSSGLFPSVCGSAPSPLVHGHVPSSYLPWQEGSYQTLIWKNVGAASVTQLKRVWEYAVFLAHNNSDVTWLQLRSERKLLFLHSDALINVNVTWQWSQFALLFAVFFSLRYAALSNKDFTFKVVLTTELFQTVTHCPLRMPICNGQHLLDNWW